MSLSWTVLGSIGQLLLAYLLFMAAAFSGAGVVNGPPLDKRSLAVMNAAMFLLPGACVLAATIVVALYLAGAGPAAYWWFALPLVPATLHVACLRRLGRRPSARTMPPS